MSNIWILLKAQLINFFPINEIRDSRNKKQSSMAIASFGIITLSLFCFVYNIIDHLGRIGDGLGVGHAHHACKTARGSGGRTG